MLYTVDQQKLVLAVAEELKNHIEMPEWALFVKTGSHRETLPRNADWWYIRAASVLRYCNMKGPVGVSKLRTKYGGRKNRGMAPDKFALASGKVIRVILQQLEAAKLLKQDVVGTHKGRVATPTGAAILVKAAKSLGNEKSAKVATKATTKKAEKVENKTEESVEVKEETKVEQAAKEPKKGE
ncbi:30S ribosomal protein S19e [Candidatus Woesearchaeota archaeon]|nr:30S ribosomal protein S19e [Candidatus Woesearchaeota archaeon]